MTAARKALVAADADFARALAEDETGRALDSGRRTLSGTDLNSMENIVEMMQSDALGEARRTKRSEAASDRQAEGLEESQQLRRAQEKALTDAAARRSAEDRRRDRTPSRERRARSGNKKDKKRSRRDRSVKIG